MDLLLKRTDYTDAGIFGEILDAENKLLYYSLERAYDSGFGNGSYLPKVPDGTYKCIKGLHQLKHMTFPFETFEITNVPGHTRILFHVGNYNNDSDGCVLLGTNLSKNSNPPCITQSNKAFNAFIVLQKDLNEFALTVSKG